MPGGVTATGLLYMHITITATPEEVESAETLRKMLEDDGNEVEVYYTRPSGEGFLQ